MKTAVIITGHMRTFATCIHSIKWHVLRHYRNLSFYVSTIRDGDTDTIKLLDDLFPGAPVHVDVVDVQPAIPEPPEPVRFEPYARSVPLQAVLRQLWQLERSWRLFEDNGGEADVVLRIRPDNFYHNFKPPAEAVSGIDAITPWFGIFGGINDRMAVLGPFAARHYFETFSNIPKLTAAGCPLHPESLISASLELNGCRISRRLKTEFSTLRKDGNHRSPEVGPVDVAHLLIEG